MARDRRRIATSDRRDFLRGGAALVLAFSWRGGAALAAGGRPAIRPDSFIRIGSDNKVTLICKFLEMGQGIHTGAATLVAEELDAAWSQMQVETAPADPTRYLNNIMGMQVTGGSASMADSWDELRQAGAAARAMLVAAASEKWAVPAAEIAVKDGIVTHRSGKSASFGDLAESASRQKIPASVTLKAATEYRLIGQPGHRIDTLGKTTGKAVYASDMTMPGMLVALVRRPPLFGARVRGFDAHAARALPDVVDIIQLPTGIAVVARTFWAARQGCKALVIDWDESVAEKRSSAELSAEYRALADIPGRTVKKRGDAEAAMAGAARRIVSSCELPYLAHAPMEPIGCVVRLTADSCDVWSGTQLPGFDFKNLPALVGLPPEKVHIHTIYAGGSFGRRTRIDSEYMVEALLIAKARGDGVPIKLQWSREDDITGGNYRPMYYHRIEGGLDAAGNLIAWHHRLVGQPLYGGAAIDFASIEGVDDMAYDVPSVSEWHATKVGVPILAWRAVGNTHNAFAIETAIDEFAHAAGRDPLDFRRDLLKGQARYLNVLELAAEKSGWGTPLPSGRGRGFAMHKLQGFADKKGPYGSYVAYVVEVSVAQESIRIDRVVCAIDCGIAINPDIVRAQMEGSIAMGMGSALREGITLDRGLVQQSNFDTYRPMRIDEMPRVETHIVPSNARPTGVGEPGIPPAAPALANAVFAATGRRVRALPILPFPA